MRAHRTVLQANRIGNGTDSSGSADILYWIKELGLWLRLKNKLKKTL